MRTTLSTLCTLLCTLGLLVGCERRAGKEVAAAPDQPAADTAATKTAAVTATGGKDTLDWRPAPPGLPAGARGAVLSGDPTKPGPYTIKMDMPAGYRVLPHHHPKAEQVRVLEGTVLFGRGRRWDDDSLRALAAGAEMTVKPLQPHFVEAKERTLLEVRGTGPFTITYENPTDDPRKAPIQ